MTAEGFVTLDGEEIGTFKLNQNGDVSVTLNKMSNSFAEMLEFATEQGMNLGLTLKPDFNEYIPKH